MTKNSLPDCTREWFGFSVQTKLARFKTQGWFGTGQTDCHCSTCSNMLWGFRKPYTTTKGDYLYWALVCSNCRTATDPASLPDSERKLLYKSSEKHAESVEPPRDYIQKILAADVAEYSPTRLKIGLSNDVENQCQSCKHAKNVNSKETCVALQVPIDLNNHVVGCVHYNSVIDHSTGGANFIDEVMKERSRQDQPPDKFSTDKKIYFNKIKRK